MIRWKITDIHQGLRLRRQGLSYEAIAIVFREYHGLDVTGGAVRHQLRAHGAVSHPRGSQATLIPGQSGRRATA